MSHRAPAVVSLQQNLFERPSSLPQKQRAHATLWATIFFPQLSLEVLETDGADIPYVVVHLQEGQRRVWQVSEAAYDYGVKPGMALTEAYALSPTLVSLSRNEVAERDMLQQLAEWAGQYTAMVSLEPDALLLELSGSVKLFGGLAKLLAQLRNDGLEHGYHFMTAVAPTPQAALLLARYGEQAVINDVQALRHKLGQLPINVLPWNNKQHALAVRLGLRILRDLWRLPSDGLAKRFGLGFTEYLDRLLGNKPEPRLGYQAAPTFSTSWAFPLETDQLTFIFHGLEKLVERLVQFMRLRSLSLNQLSVIFYHSDRPVSQMDLRSQQLCHQADHLLMLLHEKLSNEKLVAPVMEFSLVVNEFHSVVPETPSLFVETGKNNEAQNEPQNEPQWQQFLDKLQTRLGRHAVMGLQILNDHRPERAGKYGTAQCGEAKQLRPVWLLSQPQHLSNSLKDIRILSESERIEGGWWDGFDIRRDYYQAVDGRGRRLWLYRNLNNRQWYLHGLFS